MTPPKINRESLALSKKLAGGVRANAEREMERQMQSMSANEPAKLNRLLSNIKYLGDMGTAARKSRVGRKLLDKWMNTPGVSWQINTALNEAQAMSHGSDTAEDVLFRKKIMPQLENDAEVFRATGQRCRESKAIAKLAARNLKEYRWRIVQAANNRDKHFFIDLGRILSGDASSELYDRIDADLADMFVTDPTMSTAEAMIELANRGHPDVQEHTVRQRKSRLGLAKPRAAKSDKSHPASVTNNRAKSDSIDAPYDSSKANSGKSGQRPRKRRPAH